MIECMQVHDQLARMDAQQLRQFAANLIETVVSNDRELQYQQLKIEQLTHEMAVLKRWKFAARSQQLHGTQRSLRPSPNMEEAKKLESRCQNCLPAFNGWLLRCPEINHLGFVWV